MIQFTSIIIVANGYDCYNTYTKPIDYMLHARSNAMSKRFNWTSLILFNVVFVYIEQGEGRLSGEERSVCPRGHCPRGACASATCQAGVFRGGGELSGAYVFPST